MSAPAETLPFNEKRQDAILGHLLLNDRFFKQCKDRIKPQWFVDGHAGKIWAAKLKFYERYARIPSHEELIASEGFRNETQGDRNRLTVKTIEAHNLTSIYRLDALLPELTTWLHSRYFHEGVHEGQNLFNAGKFPEAYQALDQKLTLIKNTSFENDIAFDFDNLTQFFERRIIETQNCLSFGLSAMDRLILPSANGTGSLMRGDTTVLLAPTNVGKTTTMITIAAHNVRCGKAVLMLTHEGVDDDIAEKMLCSMMNCNKAELYDKPKTVEGAEQLSVVQRLLKLFFTYIALPKAGMNVEEVAAIIRHRQEDRMATTGRGYDLLIDDYPAKLGSQNMQFGQFQKRNLDEYVYNYFVQLALEYKFHALLAIQANRTGSKINRGQKGFEDRLLTMEDVNESYGPMQIATNVITINRDPLCESLGYVIYYISKSRSAEKGWAVVCRSNYRNNITHSDSLGCTFYRGDVPLGDQIESLFVGNKGQEILPHVVRAAHAN